MEKLLPLQQLVAICRGATCNLHQLQMNIGDGSSVTVLFRSAVEPPDPQRRRPSSRDFLVTADGLPGDFSSLINRWYDIARTYRVSVRELFDVIQLPDRFVDALLVSYVRVIAPLLDAEQKKAADEHADENYEAWLQRVSDALPEDLRDSVIGKLGPTTTNDRNVSQHLRQDSNRWACTSQAGTSMGTHNEL